MLETDSRADRSEDETNQDTTAARPPFEAVLPAEYPHLAEAAPYLSASHDADAAFERGLDLLLAGLDELRPTT
jgi:hypothetical protein